MNLLILADVNKPMDTLTVILAIISSVLTIIGVYYGVMLKRQEFKQKQLELDRKKEDEEKETKRSQDLDLKLDKRIKLLVDLNEGTNQFLREQEKTIQENKKVLDGINESLKKHVDEEFYRKDIQNVIQNTTHQFVLYNKNTLDINYAMLLWSWSNRIEHFAISYYELKSINEDKQEFREKLRQQMEIMIIEFNKDIDISIDNYVMKGATRLTLVKLIKQAAVHQKTYALVEKLADNGMTKEELLHTFKRYITEFSGNFLACCATWNQELLLNKPAA